MGSEAQGAASQAATNQAAAGQGTKQKDPKKKSIGSRIVTAILLIIFFGGGAFLVYMYFSDGFSHPYAPSAGWVVSGYSLPGSGENYDFTLDEHGGTTKATITTPAGTKVVDFELNLHGYPKKATVNGLELGYYPAQFNDKNGWPQAIEIIQSTNAIASFQYYLDNRLTTDPFLGNNDYLNCMYKNNLDGVENSSSLSANEMARGVFSEIMGSTGYQVKYSKDASGVVNGATVTDTVIEERPPELKGDIPVDYMTTTVAKHSLTCQRDEAGNIVAWLDENGNVYKEIRYTYIEKPYMQYPLVTRIYASPVMQVPVLFLPNIP